MKKRGFTLIELLVVIAIIALLLSILLPSLQAVKHRARGTVCISNLKHWSFSFLLYASDNNDKLPPSWVGWGIVHDTPEKKQKMFWANILIPYIKSPSGFTYCPSAKKSSSQAGYYANDYDFVDPQVAWGPFPHKKSDGEFHHFGPIEDTGVKRGGSYGINGWAADGSSVLKQFWQKTTVNQQLNRIPLIGDHYWVWSNPTDTDIKFAVRENTRPPNQLSYFVINRHHKGLNLGFLDGSARRVHPRELWNLKWSKVFQTQGVLDDDELLERIPWWKK